MKQFINFLVFLVLFNISCLAIKSEVNMTKISKEKILRIANKKAINLGYNIVNMKIDIDDNNTVWNNYNKNNVILDINPELQKRLRDKEYWAVYYTPKKLQFGGDLWIFVDKNNFKIITFIKGE